MRLLKKEREERERSLRERGGGREYRFFDRWTKGNWVGNGKIGKKKNDDMGLFQTRGLKG